MMAGLPACYFCVKALPETDQTADLKKIDVPTLILHGDDDQIVPIADSAMLSSRIVKNATLVVYKGGPHGMCTTDKDRVNTVACFHQGKAARSKRDITTGVPRLVAVRYGSP